MFCTLVRVSPGVHRLEEELYESSPGKKVLRVLVDEKCNMSQQCTVMPEALKYPGLHQEKESQQSERSGCPFLLCPCKPLCGVLHSGLGSPDQEGCGGFRTGPEEGTKMTRGLEHHSYENTLMKLVLFSLAK